MGDWDGDGDWDMAMGVISGPVKLYKNNGDLTFTDAGVFKAADKEITAHDGGPCIVDWDGDGTLDLMLGDGEGNVKFYKGTAKGSLALATDENLFVIPQADQKTAWVPRKLDPDSPTGFKPARPGVRTKPFAADWNGDGRLDLLVGDYISIEAQSKPLTPAQKQELAALEKRQPQVMKKMGDASKKLQKKALAEAGLKDFNTQDKEKMKKYSAAFNRLYPKDKGYQAAMKEYMALNETIMKLRPRAEGTGVAWVYLRK